MAAKAAATEKLKNNSSALASVVVRYPCTLVASCLDRDTRQRESDGEAVGGGRAVANKRKRCGCHIGRGARALVRVDTVDGNVLEKYCR